MERILKSIRIPQNLLEGLEDVSDASLQAEKANLEKQIKDSNKEVFFKRKLFNRPPKEVPRLRKSEVFNLPFCDNLLISSTPVAKLKHVSVKNQDNILRVSPIEKSHNSINAMHLIRNTEKVNRTSRTCRVTKQDKSMNVSLQQVVHYLHDLKRLSTDGKERRNKNISNTNKSKAGNKSMTVVATKNEQTCDDAIDDMLKKLDAECSNNGNKVFTISSTQSETVESESISKTSTKKFSANKSKEGNASIIANEQTCDDAIDDMLKKLDAEFSNNSMFSTQSERQSPNTETVNSHIIEQISFKNMSRTSKNNSTINTRSRKQVLKESLEVKNTKNSTKDKSLTKLSSQKKISQELPITRSRSNRSEDSHSNKIGKPSVNNLKNSSQSKNSRTISTITNTRNKSVSNKHISNKQSENKNVRKSLSVNSISENKLNKKELQQIGTKENTSEIEKKSTKSVLEEDTLDNSRKSTEITSARPRGRPRKRPIGELNPNSTFIERTMNLRSMTENSSTCTEIVEVNFDGSQSSAGVRRTRRRRQPPLLYAQAYLLEYNGGKKINKEIRTSKTNTIFRSSCKRKSNAATKRTATKKSKLKQTQGNTGLEKQRSRVSGSETLSNNSPPSAKGKGRKSRQVVRNNSSSNQNKENSLWNSTRETPNSVLLSPQTSNLNEKDSSGRSSLLEGVILQNEDIPLNDEKIVNLNENRDRANQETKLNDSKRKNQSKLTVIYDVQVKPPSNKSNCITTTMEYEMSQKSTGDEIRQASCGSKRKSTNSDVNDVDESIMKCADKSSGDYLHSVVNNEVRSHEWCSSTKLTANTNSEKSFSIQYALKGIPTHFSHTWTGYLQIPPGKEKPMQVVRKYYIVYMVTNGSAIVKIQNKRKLINQGGDFVIPIGFEYSITNASDSEPLQLYFVKSSSVRRDATFNI